MTSAIVIAILAISVAFIIAVGGRRQSPKNQEDGLTAVAQAIVGSVVKAGDPGVPESDVHAWLAARGIHGNLCDEILAGLCEGGSLALHDGRYMIGPKTMLVLFLGHEGAKKELERSNREVP